MLKKINSALAFFSALAALAHVVLMGLTMFGAIGFSPAFTYIGRALLTAYLLHIVLALIIVFFRSGDGIAYPKLNKATVAQRITALVLMVFVHFHMVNYFSNGEFVAPSVFGLITEVLFAYCTFSHFMCSLEKGLTTFGIDKKPLEIGVRLLSAAALLYSLTAIGFYFLRALL